MPAKRSVPTAHAALSAPARRRDAFGIAALAAVLVGASTHAQDGDAPIAPPKEDRYLIRLGSSAANGAESKPLSGRLILFFLPDTPRWAGIAPTEGPFLIAPTPIASVAVREVGEGGQVVIEADASGPVRDDFSALGALAELEGSWTVQAVLDSDFTVAGHLAPGNLRSEPIKIELSRGTADEVAIELTAASTTDAAQKSAQEAEPPAATAGVERFERPSKLLTSVLRTPASIRATVVLPFGYDDLAYPRRMWPTVYVLGDFGSDGAEAFESAAVLRDPMARAAVPQAVWVFLDASSAWGHGAFCDSDAHGPRLRALLEEFIPALEERFRLIPESEARVLLGHGFGGWNAIHLALAAPDTFGSCYASAPDFVDFSALGRIDLYRDAAMFTARDGSDAPAVRSILGPNDDRLHLTLRDQIGAERAVDPRGRSGLRWAARDATWSPWDGERDAPRAICDATTGAIDPIAGESWSRFDVAARLERDPAATGPILAGRVHMLASARDSFYRNEAVARLKAKLGAWRAKEASAGRTTSDRGRIEILDDLDDEALRQVAVLRFHRDIAAALRANGFAEPLRLDEESRANRPLGEARPLPAPPPQR
jgi:hypothetical protein